MLLSCGLQRSTMHVKIPAMGTIDYPRHHAEFCKFSVYTKLKLGRSTKSVRFAPILKKVAKRHQE